MPDMQSRPENSSQDKRPVGGTQCGPVGGPEGWTRGVRLITPKQSAADPVWPPAQAQASVLAFLSQVTTYLLAERFSQLHYCAGPAGRPQTIIAVKRADSDGTVRRGRRSLGSQQPGSQAVAGICHEIQTNPPTRFPLTALVLPLFATVSVPSPSPPKPGSAAPHPNTRPARH